MIKKIGILYHPLKPTAQTLAREIQDFCARKDVAAWVGSAWEEEGARANMNGTDLLLCIGGDGTILRAAQIAQKEQIPITGINQGNLGFLTEFTADNAVSGLDTLLQGKGVIDERAMIEAELLMSGKYVRNYYALNDIVIARGATARLVLLEVKVNGERLTTYRADGVIIATATGSTGYALAAGGPILYPQSPELLLTPILPHLSLAHSLVLPSTGVVSVILKTAFPGTLSIDGHVNLPITDGAVITARHSDRVTRFMRTGLPSSFYGTLEQKLKGKTKE